ncbi:MULTISPECIES: ABC transporter permease [unclassified Cytobacillus]|uniref:ABC transporter permease n=1 Tax=unclassified Cytobacillus TaxID=2675268 RepID=UPI00135B2BF2|nr:ABC transporter permease [Cytobacillus sp. AMY 15.2]KAF0818006.1 ABC transporter, permease protein EscB [Bacillus sp. ZZV12-4809]MCM3092413.1 ABC transporter permease [Cytobacillus sp. AMY 15.2]
MFNEKQLWKERFGRTFKELSRYLRYIFNGHIVIVMLFLLGTAAFYYQEWIKTLPNDFPAAVIMAAILALIVTYSPIYTFFSEADKIFLLPLEDRLSGYFIRSLLVSFFVHAYLLVLGLGVFIPLYAAVNDGNFKLFLPFLMILLTLKIINLLIRWKIQYYIETSVHLLDACVRYAVNAVFLYFLFSGASTIFILAPGVLLILLYLFFSMKSRNKGLKWEYLIEQEERRMTSFYRLANMFTDVPKLKDRVKRRKWLDWLLSGIPFRQDATFKNLYVRTFLRSGDYFGLFIRLTLIGAGAIYLISYGMGQIVLVPLIMYLTGFQLVPLWNHYQDKLWVNLYPVKADIKEKSFKQLLTGILYVQALILSLAVMAKGGWLASLLALAAGVLFAYVYTHFYIQKRLAGS